MNFHEILNDLRQQGKRTTNGSCRALRVELHAALMNILLEVEEYQD